MVGIRKTNSIDLGTFSYVLSLGAKQMKSRLIETEHESKLKLQACCDRNYSLAFLHEKWSKEECEEYLRSKGWYTDVVGGCNK
jgi:hypothetical protein